MKRFSLSLVILGLLVPVCVCSAVEGLILRIVLDSSDLMVGEPLTGEVILENVSSDTICVESKGERLTAFLSFNFIGPSERFEVTVNSIYGPAEGHVFISNTPVRTNFPIGGQKREPFILLTRNIGKGFFDPGHSVFVLGEPGKYSVVARIVARGVDGKHFQVGKSDTVSFWVNPRGAGFAPYDRVTRQLNMEIKKPFNFYIPEWVNANWSIVHFGDYSSTLETIVAYQYGGLLKHPMLYNGPNPYVSRELLIKHIRGGIVGQNILAIRRWRVALLFEMGEPIGEDEWPPGDFDQISFISSMPGRGNKCDPNGGN